MNYLNIHAYKPIVEECKGCMFSYQRFVGGDKTIICRRHAYPHTKWWFDYKCKDFKLPLKYKK